MSAESATPRYLRHLSEYTDGELLRELHERARRRHVGICDYCGLRADDPECRFPERHRMAKKKGEA